MYGETQGSRYSGKDSLRRHEIDTDFYFMTKEEKKAKELKDAKLLADFQKLTYYFLGIFILVLTIAGAIGYYFSK